MKPLAIVLLTYQRTEYALRTMRAAKANLRTARNVWWYVADDGSDDRHYRAVMKELEGCNVIGSHNFRRGYGGNANMAIAAVDSTDAEVTLWLEDDWELTQPLELDPYINALERSSDFAMIRLGYLNLHMRGFTIGLEDRLYWALEHIPAIDGSPVFTGHPSLRHKRYVQKYGYYPEGFSPGQTELEYAFHYRSINGPYIAWPCDMPPYGYFAHIGEVKSI